MTQDQFDWTKAHHSAHRRDTEVRAAEDAWENAPKGCRIVRSILRRHGPLTDEEGRKFYYSFPQRRCDLAQPECGLVVDTGKRRLTKWGKPAIVWALKEEA